MTIQAILETALYAADLDSAERFYRDVLALEFYASQEGRHVFFRCGRGMLLIFDPRATEAEETPLGGGFIPRHGARGPGHAAFAIRAGEIPAWRERLSNHGVPIESEIDWPAGGHSIYFRDPAGNSVELATPRLWGLEE